MTGDLVVRLEGGGAPLEAVGGKAAAVDRMIAMGMPVPPAAAVTTAAYRCFVEEAGLRRFLDELDERPLPEPDEIDDEAERVDRAFLEAELPTGLRRTFEALAEDLGGEVSVRSSATVEDAEAASYAGQFRTELGVPTAGVAHAVRLVWASLWSPAVRAYRQATGGGGSLEMGVLVMPMIDARHAGVAFTADPGGRDDHMRVEVVQGLGEALVSGAETPDAFVVPREGDRGFPTPLAPALDELCDRSLHLERELGAPQDVEWAHDGDRLWLLQTRPITTAAGAVAGPGPAEAPAEGPAEGRDDDGFDTPLAEGCTFTSAGVAEMLPGVLPPLLWTINGHLLEQAMRRIFDDLGVLPADLTAAHAVVARVRGRAALNLDLLRSLAGRIPGGSPAELERQYFGEALSDDDTPGADGDGDAAGAKAGGDAHDRSGGSLLGQLGPMIRAARMRRRLRREAGVVVGAIDRVIAMDIDVKGLPPDRLASYHHGVLDLAERAVALEAAVAATAAAAYRGLELFLERYVGDEADTIAQRATSGHIEACRRTALEVCDLVAEAMGDPELEQALLECGSPEELPERLGSARQGRRFLERFDATVERAGSARVFAGRTWAEQEGVAWSALRQAVERRQSRREPARRQQRADVLGGVEQRIATSWKWRLTRVVTGQVVDARLRLLHRLADDAAWFLGAREEAKAAVLRLGGEARRTIKRMAELLHDRGALRDRGDVELLSHTELLVAVTRAGDVPDDEVLDRRRQALEQADAAGTLPRRFTGRPAPVEAAAAEGDELAGWGASPGEHRGRARVVRDLRSAQLADGDVLVAHSTDPSWTPLFLTAGAVVVEQGGPLSHAAIVARELGIPAVLNVPGAVARLQDADEVTVDGTAGRIVVAGADGPDQPSGGDDREVQVA